MEVDIPCCVVRDPIKRFISTYSNRILFHKDKAFYNFSVDEVIENLEGLNFFNKHYAYIWDTTALHRKESVAKMQVFFDFDGNADKR